MRIVFNHVYPSWFKYNLYEYIVIFLSNMYEYIESYLREITLLLFLTSNFQ